MVGKRLGRGLDFFLSGSGHSGSASGTEGGGGEQGEEVAQIPLASLVPSLHQPRRHFDEGELEDLARSIQTSGILQPILVRRAGKQYEIIAGERRWRAAQRAGLETIPALVRTITDEKAAIFGLVENIHRTDLNAIERGKALEKILKMTKGSQEELARRVGLQRSSVTNLLRLLDLPETVQKLVSRGTISMGHARALLSLSSDEEREALAGEVVRKKLSVRQVESLVQALQDSTAQKTGDKVPRQSRRERPAWLNEIEETLVEVLGTPVHVQYGRKRARITIECMGREEFERVYDQLKAIGEGPP